ncbi:hypothetical protein EHQ53_10320 [Leptospira langatensis]|uniref:Lipoprotein n=1 Tax=Leptospira langatensis TaxID=2484983 RepID=A0A5F1ZT23_9LEPT|nr:hypothetical protein [Leptospira langatensis]TGK00175.1 hypothetical protein EHO57_12875 [Leptospira langatensis]TGL41195.1 hypothetical protein EHQ53_10320 [Leptospira langatensis]
MFQKSLGQISVFLLLCSLCLDCSDSLKGKPTPAIPELAGFYVSERSRDWLKENKLKIQALWIRRSANGEMEFMNKSITRLQFSVSDNREELKTRTGKVLTSGREILLLESIYREYHRQYSGKNNPDAKDWDLRSFGPFAKVKEVSNLIGEGTGRGGQLAPDNNSIRFSNGETYYRIGGPLLGRISVNVNKTKRVIDNETAGVIFFPLSPTAFPEETGKQSYLAFFSTTESLSPGMPLRIGDYSGSIKEVFDHLCVVDLSIKPGTQAPSLTYLTPMVLDGQVDLKTISHKESTEELIRRLKQDPNVSKEELIRELEKLKGRDQ